MKKLKSFFVLFAVILMFTACDNGEKQQETIEKIEKLEYNETTPKYKYSIVIPQISNIQSEDISYFNLTMQEEARLVIDSLLGVTEEIEVSAPYEANIGFQIKENTFGVLSIILQTYTYEGGAHGNTSWDTYNIELKNHTLLNFDSVFNENARDYFNMKVNDLITASENNSRKVLNTSGDPVLFFGNPDVNIDNAVMYFEGDNVVFVFPLYELAPYSSGMPVFKFDKKELKNYFR